MSVIKRVAVLASGATLLASLAVATGSVVSSASAAQTETTCAPVVLYGVRGSNEPAGWGRNLGNTWSTLGVNSYHDGLGAEVRGVKNYVVAHSGKTVRVAAVKYPASIISNSSTYFSSKNQGAQALTNELNALASVCPASETVLVGYSQGAAVIGDVLADVSSGYTGNEGISKLSATARRNIKAAALEADPDYVRAQLWDAASTPMPRSGFFPTIAAQAPSLHLFPAPIFSTFNGTARGDKGRVLSWCSTGDYFCQSVLTSAGMTVHSTSYNNAAHFTAIGGWIDSKL